jgi:hypothetical protein
LDGRFDPLGDFALKPAANDAAAPAGGVADAASAAAAVSPPLLLVIANGCTTSAAGESGIDESELAARSLSLLLAGEPKVKDATGTESGAAAGGGAALKGDEGEKANGFVLVGLAIVGVEAAVMVKEVWRAGDGGEADEKGAAVDDDAEEEARVDGWKSNGFVTSVVIVGLC